MMEKNQMKSEDYFDIPMTLHAVIAVQAETEDKAKAKLANLDDVDLVKLLASQVDFVGEGFKSTMPN